MSINDLEVTGPDTGPDNQVNTRTEVNTKQNVSEETTSNPTNQSISFNSGDIKKTSFEGLFTNIKGEDARKKAEERQQEAHDKELDRRRKEFQNQLKQQEKHSKAEIKRRENAEIKAHKKAERDAKRKARSEKIRQNIVFRFFFAKWHKFVTLAVVLAVAIGVPLTFIHVINPSIEKSNTEKQIQAEDDSRNYATEVRERALELWHDNEAYEDANKIFEDEMASHEGLTKFYIGVYYADFLTNYSYEYEKAIEVLDSIADLKGDEESLNVDYYMTYYNIYAALGDTEKMDEYLDIVVKYRPELMEGPIEGAYDEE